MDYIGILKEAWTVTWREKKLWWLGLFAGAGASAQTFSYQFNGSDFSGSSGNGNNQIDVDPNTPGIQLDSPELQRAFDDMAQWFDSIQVHEWIWGVVILISVLMLIAFVFAVVRIAARGGLVQQGAEALQGHEVSVREGWRIGWRRWWRVLGIEVLLALAVFGVVVVFGGAAAAFIALSAASDMAPIAIVGGGGLAVIGVVALIAASLLASILQEVALRHAVLGDIGAVDSIKTTWADVRGRKGVLGMWLVMLLVGIAVGIAAGIIFIPFAIVATLVVGAAVVGGFTGGGPGMIVAAIVPVALIGMALGFLFRAVHGTFTSTAWTSFYLKMDAAPETMAVAGAPVAPTPPAPPEATASPGAPVAPPAPPTPEAPASPEPPASPEAHGPDTV